MARTEASNSAGFGKSIDYSGTSTINGWGGVYTIKVLKYNVNYAAKLLQVIVQLTGTGSGVSTNFTLPFTADIAQVFFLHTKNNTSQAAAYATIAAGSNVVNVGNTASSTTVGGWTNAVARDVEGFFLITIQ